MLRDIKISLRRLKSDVANTIIKLSGLVVGLAIAAIVLVFSVNELKYDKFHTNGDRIFQVIDTAKSYGVIWATTPFIVGEELSQQFPEVEAYAHHYDISEFSIKRGENLFDETNILCTEASFFDIFSFNLLQGSVLPLNENSNVIILSKSKAEKYFGLQNPIGQVLQFVVNDSVFNMSVCGVIADFPKSSSIKANFVASIDFSFPHLCKTMINTGGVGRSIEEIKTDWEIGVFFTNYLLLKEHVNAMEFEEKLTAYAGTKGENRHQSQMAIKPFTEMYFDSDDLTTNNRVEKGNMQMLIILGVVGFIILAVAIVNYFNISVAQIFAKSRVIAIHKICGAQRLSIVKQFVLESVIISLLTLPIALFLTYLLLPMLSATLEKNYGLNVFDNWLSIVLIIGVTIAVGVLSGFMISLKAVSKKAIDAIKNSDGKKQKLLPSKVMLSFQLVILMVLVISVFGIYKQINYSINKDLGFESENLLVIEFQDKSAQPSYEIFKETIKSNPDILNVSGAMWLPPTANNMFISTQKKDNPELSVNMMGLFVDYDFIETMGFKLLEGESFSNKNVSSGVIINEMALKQLGLTGIEGEAIAYGPAVGLVQDFHYGSVHNKISPSIIVLDPDMIYEMVLRVAPGKTLTTIDYLEEQWLSFNSDKPFVFEFYDKKIQSLYESDMKMAKVITGFALLAIFIAVLGLVGLSLFASKQRVKEIGIRKVNGATIVEIMKMLNKEFVLGVIVAFLVACPIAYFAMSYWLDNFAYKTSLSWWVFVLAGVLSMAISLLSVSWQTYRAARRNPIEALRCE